MSGFLTVSDVHASIVDGYVNVCAILSKESNTLDGKDEYQYELVIDISVDGLIVNFEEIVVVDDEGDVHETINMPLSVISGVRYNYDDLVDCDARFLESVVRDSNLAIRVGRHGVCLDCSLDFTQ